MKKDSASGMMRHETGSRPPDTVPHAIIGVRTVNTSKPVGGVLARGIQKFLGGLAATTWLLAGATKAETTAPYLNGLLPPRAPQVSDWTIVPAFTNLTLPQIVGIFPEPESSRLWALCRTGQVYALENDPSTATAELILDISHQTMGRSDSGLLNLVFHPEFATAGSAQFGSFYLWYNYHPDPDPDAPALTTTWVRLSRFQRPPGSSQVDASSELVLIEQQDRHLHHSGGGMFFHPHDGFLYIALSDEGSGYDRVSTQKLDENLFSGVIRIDVDQRGGDISRPIQNQPLDGHTAHYYIPTDNPWVDVEGALHEFYALGLRNPHRMSYDATDDIAFIGDVGQSGREEINVLVRGMNYQWPFQEGTLSGPRPRPVTVLGLEAPPLHEYGRTEGVCVIGGFVYRGQKLASQLFGRYIFADYNGAIFAMDYSDLAAPVVERLAKLPGSSHFSSLGQDHAGEIFFCRLATGEIYTIEPVFDSEVPVPERLSQLELFAELETLTAGPDLLPYTVNASLWSDNAQKLRWMVVPQVGENAPASASIGFHPTETWTFPPGTVFVKHFELQTNHLDPESLRRLETRLLVMDADGGAYGLTYRWNDDQTDALLLPDRHQEDFQVQNPHGTINQTWAYPGRQDCMECHTSAAGFVLGVNTRQFNRPVPEHANSPDPTENQLDLLQRLGLIDTETETPSSAGFSKLVDPYDAGKPLHQRARSYLDVNCSGCHRPEGVRAAFDARFATPPIHQSLVNEPAGDDLGLLGLVLLKPGDPEASAIHLRPGLRGPGQMPPLGTRYVDTAGRDLLAEWILATPDFQVVSPVNEQHVPGGSLQIAVAPKPGSTAITSLDYYLNGEWSETSDSPLEEHELSLSSPWQDTLQVVAVSPEQVPAPSPPIRFHADGGGPAFSLITPDMPIRPEENTPFTVTPIDPDNPITHVEFFVNGLFVGSSDSSAPEVDLSDLPSGLHTFDAIGYGTDGTWYRAPSVQAIVDTPPAVTLSWPDTGSNLLHVPLLSFVPPLDQVASDHRWRGYFNKPPVLSNNAPDPWGGTQAVRFASADFGGSTGGASGIYVPTDTRIAPGRYVVSVWLRSVEEPLSMWLGLSDHPFYDEIEVPTTWTHFLRVFDVSQCGCYADYRVFQIAERVMNNSPWEVAFPEVYLLPGVSVHADVYGTPDTAPTESVSLLHGVHSAAVLSSFPLPPPDQLPFTLPGLGYYRVVARANSVLGYHTDSNPLHVLVGNAPDISVDYSDRSQPTLLIKAPPGQPAVLESSENFILWEDWLTFTNQPTPRVQFDTGGSPVRFLRIRMNPMP